MGAPRSQLIDDEEFKRRLAKIRVRFSAKLGERIRCVRGALQAMPCQLPESAVVVALAYRQIHDICGMAATVGLTATGLSARSLDSLLIGPFRAERGLTDDELAQLESGLAALSCAALSDISHETVQE